MIYSSALLLEYHKDGKAWSYRRFTKKRGDKRPKKFAESLVIEQKVVPLQTQIQRVSWPRG